MPLYMAAILRRRSMNLDAAAPDTDKGHSSAMDALRELRKSRQWILSMHGSNLEGFWKPFPMQVAQYEPPILERQLSPR